jgi:glycosyltransferase involved in cell wall biosynthesis
MEQQETLKNKYKILFVTSELPYPPRNGVTIPLFYTIKELSYFHDVFLLVVHDTPLSNDSVKQNSRFVKGITVVPRKKMNLLMVLMREIMMVAPSFQSWNYDWSQIKDNQSLRNFDVIWGSPINVADVPKMLSCKLLNNQKKPLLITTISDSYTSVLRNTQIEGGIGERLLSIISRMRSYLMAKLETNIVKDYSYIFVQTDKDKKWIDENSNNTLSNRVIVLPNGVNPELLDIPIGSDRYSTSNQLLYVGSLDRHYRNKLKWFITEVWPAIVENFSNASFLIVGKGAAGDPGLVAKIERDPHITNVEYIDDITSVYIGKMILVAPIYKNHGLINKVIEGMAAGTVVVGDQSAFNGVTGFINGTHGVIADDAPTMIASIVKLLSDAEATQQIANNARRLIAANFQWSSRGDHINKLLAQQVQRPE